MKKIFLSTVMLWLAGAVAAQDVTACPANVLLAFARAATTCASTGYLQACYGNGAVQTDFQPEITAVRFEQPGDTAAIADLQAVHLTASAADNIWSVITLSVRANLVDVQQRSLTILLFGNMNIVNLVPPIPQMTVQAIGALVIRHAPDENADIVQKLSVGSEVRANGRTADGRWLRVLIPNSSDYGWVSVDLVKNTGFNDLNVVDVTTPVKQPFQEITLVSGSGDAFCAGAPESGAMLQSPDTVTPVTLLINNIEVQISGTVFAQADDTSSVRLHVLDGQVIVSTGGQRQLIPVGSQLTVTTNAAPGIPESYDMTLVQPLPLTNLPYRFALPQPLTPAQIDAALAQFVAIPTPTPEPGEPGEHKGCEYVVIRDTSLRAGPASFYEVLRDIPAGTELYNAPRLEVKDADGVAWWQLYTSAWLNSRDVRASEGCLPVPTAEQAEPPYYNRLIMETCETTNGPLREGQYVTIEFTPPSWETVREALDAPSIAPGSIVINNREYLYVYASNPIKVADKAYVVRFEGEWMATAGKQRIVSKRLFYELICELTVPVGN